MSTAVSLSVADQAVAGGAASGVRLLGLVQRMMRTGMAMARCVNRIARQRLAGQDLRRLAPAGFDATLTNAWVVQAVAWTAALRERLLAVVRPAFAPGLPKAARTRHGRGAPAYLPEGTVEADADAWHNWRELARPLRIGPSGVAVAARLMAGLSDQEVVSQICDKLRQAAAQLGAEADIGRIAALEAAARALCPDADTFREAAGNGTGPISEKPESSDGLGSSDGPKRAAEDDPPPEPPD